MTDSTPAKGIEHKRWRLRRTWVVAFALIVCVGIAGWFWIPVPPPGYEGTVALAWDSPKMLEVKKDHDAILATFRGPDNKDTYEQRTREITALYRKRLSHQEMSGLAESCDSLPVEEVNWNNFQCTLILEMVWTFLKAGDRQSLVTLFSTRFPSDYHFLDIEALLVLHGKAIKDPILILGDAYSKSKVPEVRAAIAQVVRRAFRGSGIRGNNDAEFVQNAMEWYAREKDYLVYNYKYDGSRQIMHLHRNEPLFKRNSSAPDDQTMQSAMLRPHSETPDGKARPLKTATNSIGVKMVLIPPGSFTMGSPESEQGHRANESPQHPVRITKPFWLGAYEITQAEYESVMGKNPSAFSPKGSFAKYVAGLDAKRLPVDEVSWYDAVEFCNRLSKREGLPAFYRLSDAKPKEPWREVEVLGGHGYRLPTEAEWEYACRAGTTTRFSVGEQLDSTQAQIGGRIPVEGQHPTTVGSFPPNAFGLYDMHGNAGEYCSDGYDERYYEDCPIDDPPGPSNRRQVVLRGGGCYSDADCARSAMRFNSYPWNRDGGFRLAGSAEPAAPKPSAR